MPIGSSGRHLQARSRPEAPTGGASSSAFAPRGSNGGRFLSAFASRGSSGCESYAPREKRPPASGFRKRSTARGARTAVGRSRCPAPGSSPICPEAGSPFRERRDVPPQTRECGFTSDCSRASRSLALYGNTPSFDSLTSASVSLTRQGSLFSLAFVVAGLTVLPWDSFSHIPRHLRH